MTHHGCLIQRPSCRLKLCDKLGACKPTCHQDFTATLPLCAPFGKKRAASAAMIVNEMNNEPINAMTTLMAMGPTKSPILPLSKNIGMKPNTVVNVEANKGANK